MKINLFENLLLIDSQKQVGRNTSKAVYAEKEFYSRFDDFLDDTLINPYNLNGKD